MIIAVDFDGVLAEDAFPDIGAPDMEIIGLVKELMGVKGIEVVLWTCRVDDRLKEAVDWCAAHGLVFDAVNDNAPSNKKQYEHLYPNGTRKVYATYYLDDHNLGYSRRQAVDFLKSLVTTIKS